jgi:hypothetical protein
MEEGRMINPKGSKNWPGPIKASDVLHVYRLKCESSATAGQGCGKIKEVEEKTDEEAAARFNRDKWGIVGGKILCPDCAELA